MSVNVWVLFTITSRLPRQSLPSDIENRYSNITLVDPSFHVAAPVDLLLGADIYSQIMGGRMVSVDEVLSSVFSSNFWVDID